jgi:hypothetical protein
MYVDNTVIQTNLQASPHGDIGRGVSCKTKVVSLIPASGRTYTKDFNIGNIPIGQWFPITSGVK